MQKPVIILGAGPAGLTAAYEICKHGIPVIVLEKTDQVGGISRTETYRGFSFDIGGHRFYTKIDEIQKLWSEILGSPMAVRKRLSRIFYDGKFFLYPLNLFQTLRQLGPYESVAILISYLRSCLFPYSREDNLEQWVSNRFGRRLYEKFFKSYTEKVWGISCREIRADWAAARIRGLSVPRAVWNAVFKSNDVRTLITEFHYPEKGPGMMWEACRDRIRERGGQVWTNAEVLQLNRQGSLIASVSGIRDGKPFTLEGRAVISSLPLNELVTSIEPPLSTVAQGAAHGLNYRDFIVVALIINQAEIFPDQWIYIHTPGVRVGRIQNFKNWSPAMVPDLAKTSLGMEYFCNEADDFWSKEDSEIIEQAKRELASLGLVAPHLIEDGVVVRQKKAYPVYDSQYRAHVDQIQKSLSVIANLQTIGRNGLHRYNNQDHSMLTGLLAARNVCGKQYDVWQCDVDRSYYEEFTVSPARVSPASA